MSAMTTSGLWAPALRIRSLRVGGRRDDFKPSLLEHRDDSLTGQGVILADDDAHRTDFAHGPTLRHQPGGRSGSPDLCSGYPEHGDVACGMSLRGASPQTRPMHGTWDPPARVGRRTMTPATAAARHLVGRGTELDLLVGAVERTRDRGGALVVRGERGIGKTSLVLEAGRRLSKRGFRVLSTMGMESEANLAGSALHQLLGPLIGGRGRPALRERGARTLQTVSEPTPDRLQGLPRPQRDTLATAFGLSAGSTPDRFLLGLAVLSLLTDRADERPLLCIVDDAQWLDEMSAQVLAFVSRRLSSKPLAIVFAVREPNGRQELTSLPELWLDGLKVADARALFTSALAGPTDPEVQDRIITETRGNPLALLELAHGSTPADLAGGFAPPSATSLPENIEREFRRRLDALPTNTRRLVLLAAADPLGEPTLIWRGADQLGIAPEAAALATEAGLLEFGPKVRFRHPVLRSAAYQSASAQERCAVHGALAAATDPELDPDRRAWHLSRRRSRPTSASRLRSSARRLTPNGAADSPPRLPFASGRRC